MSCKGRSARTCADTVSKGDSVKSHSPKPSTLHRTYMGSVERGERNLTLQTVERLAQTLGIAPIDLLNKPSEPQ